MPLTVSQHFFGYVLSAGAILSGFCATFLVFRIQREAAYHRQPAVDFSETKSKDIYIGLTHFTSALLLLLITTSVAAIFGFMLPLLALSGTGRISVSPGLVVGGMIAAVVLIAAYVLDELIHYRILRTLPGDKLDWKRESPVVVGGVLLAAGVIFLFWALSP